MIGFAHNFNRNVDDNLDYPKSKYDELFSGASECDNAATALSSLNLDGHMGAGVYYGPKNMNNSSFNKYIPDAEGYPFTETRYEQDATGRVKAQSGVGPNHKIGSGHETKYYYTAPMQEDLDALFGTDVGLASHIF